MWINMNRRGLESSEPWLTPSTRNAIAAVQCIGMMVTKDFKTKEQILDDLKLSGKTA